MQQEVATRNLGFGCQATQAYGQRGLAMQYLPKCFVYDRNTIVIRSYPIDRYDRITIVTINASYTIVIRSYTIVYDRSLRSYNDRNDGAWAWPGLGAVWGYVGIRFKHTLGLSGHTISQGCAVQTIVSEGVQAPASMDSRMGRQEHRGLSVLHACHSLAQLPASHRHCRNSQEFSEKLRSTRTGIAVFTAATIWGWTPTSRQLEHNDIGKGCSRLCPPVALLASFRQVLPLVFGSFGDLWRSWGGSSCICDFCLLHL